MTSILNVDTIADKAGTGPVGFTKQVAIKAFVQQDSGTSLNESFNVSSLTDNSTGRYEVALTNAFSNANYSLNVSGGATSGNCSVDDSHYEAGVMATRFYRTDTSAYMDSDHVSMYGVGDLA